MKQKDIKVLEKIVWCVSLIVIAVLLVTFGINNREKIIAVFKQEEKISQEKKGGETVGDEEMDQQKNGDQDQSPKEIISVRGTVSAIKKGAIEIKNGEEIKSIPLTDDVEIMVVSENEE